MIIDDKDGCEYWDGESGFCALHKHADMATLLAYESGKRSAEPKRGKWEMKPDPYGWFDEIPVCSACGCTTKWREKYAYCPNCGAKMEKNEDERV